MDLMSYVHRLLSFHPVDLCRETKRLEKGFLLIFLFSDAKLSLLFFTVSQNVPTRTRTMESDPTLTRQHLYHHLQQHIAAKDATSGQWVKAASGLLRKKRMCLEIMAPAFQDLDRITMTEANAEEHQPRKEPTPRVLMMADMPSRSTKFKPTNISADSAPKYIVHSQQDQAQALQTPREKPSFHTSAV